MKAENEEMLSAAQETELERFHLLRKGVIRVASPKKRLRAKHRQEGKSVKKTAD